MGPLYRETPDPPRLRHDAVAEVLTYNVYSPGNPDWDRRFPLIRDTLRDLDADVLALQEVPVDRPDVLEELWGPDSTSVTSAGPPTTESRGLWLPAGPSGSSPDRPANPTPRTFDVPESARVLFDELTLWGDTEHARTSLEKWYAAGAEMPALTLPPGRPVEELDHILESLAPLDS